MSLLTLIIQYIPRNMHTVFALLCFVVVIHWLIFSYPSGLLHWHCGNLTIAPVPAKQPWWIWINTSCEFIMNDCITTTKQSTTKPCAYFLGYTVLSVTGLYMSKPIRSTLIRVMVCRLFGADLLPEPKLTYCKFDPKEQLSVKFESKYEFSLKEKNMKMLTTKWLLSFFRGTMD